MSEIESNETVRSKPEYFWKSDSVFLEELIKRAGKIILEKAQVNNTLPRWH